MAPKLRKRKAARIQHRQVPELPDEMLLAVLGWLPVRDLLRGARAVCRRWRDLALHPSLWKERHIAVADENFVDCEAVLRLAPLLGAISIGAYSMFDGQYPVWNTAALVLLANAGCGIGKLSLRFFQYSGTERSLLHRVLREQVRLGQLHTLTVEVVDDITADVYKMIWDAGLTELNLVSRTKMRLPPVSTPPRGGATLKRLSYVSAIESDPVQALVKAHARTLESVRLPEFASARSLELVCGCAMLREAQLPFLPELASLSRCPLLRDLTLLMNKHDYPPMTAALAAFFTGATHLGKLSIRTCARDPPLYVWRRVHTASLRDVLAALGSSGDSALEELRLSAGLEKDLLDALPGLLRGLPRLHTLLVWTVPSQRVLQRIAPGLRLFGLDYTGSDTGSAVGALCATKCYLPFLQKLVRSHPGLHVSGVPSHGSCTRSDCDCCKKGLHPHQNPSDDDEIWVSHFGLYGHDPAQPCVQPQPPCGRQKCSVLLDDSTCTCRHDWQFVGKSHK